MKTKATLGSRIDRLHELREKVRLIEEELKEAKAVMHENEVKVMRMLTKQKVTSGKSKLAIATLGHRKFASIKSRAILDKWIKKNDAQDLYQNRINSKAYFDRLEEGVKIPGVEVVEVPFLSLKTR